jgi:small conductance mechanosensitive channel
MFSFNLDQITKSNIINIGVNIIFAVIIFFIFFIIAKVLLNKIKYVKPDKNEKEKPLKNLVIPKPNERYHRGFILLYREFIAKFIFYIIILIGLVVALTKLGFNISTFLVVLGSIGLAIAFGFQGLIAQIISGILILFFQFFNLGDLVQINNDIGFIQDFNLVNTTFITNNGIKVIIPNNAITVGSFTNYSVNDEIFVMFDVSISNNYKVNYELLIERLIEAVKTSKYVIDKKNISVVVYDMSGPGTKLKIKAKIASENYFGGTSNIRLIVRQTLEDEKIRLLDNYYI